MDAPTRFSAVVLALGLCIAAPINAHAATREVLWQAKDAGLLALWTGMAAKAGRSDRHPLDGTVAALVKPSQPLPVNVPPSDADRVSAFEQALASADLVLLGEVHDNPYHHAGRGRWLERVAGHGRNAPLVSEHFRADQQDGLDRFYAFDAEARRRANVGDLFRLVDWARSGWPDETIFVPLYAAALTTKRRLFPAEPARGAVRSIARAGIDALPDEERRRFALEAPLPEALRSGLIAELKDSHCGLLPDAAVPGLLLAQRYRDAYQAEALLKAFDSDAGKTASGRRQAILIAGNGHVRRDRGVPHALQLRAPERSVVVVQLVETQPGVEAIDPYVPRGEDGAPTADYIVLTPRQPRPDPCEEMRRHMQKRREGQPGETR